MTINTHRLYRHALLIVGSWLCTVVPAAAAAPPWFAFSPQELDGSALEVVDDSASTPHEEAIEPLRQQKMKATQLGESPFLLYQAEAGKLNITGLPGDEFIEVQSGALVLSDPAGEVTTLRAGEIFLFPRNWHGTATLQGVYRERTVMAAAWTPVLAGKERDNSAAPAQPLLSIDPDRKRSGACRQPGADFGRASLRTLCTQTLYANDLVVSLQTAQRAVNYRLTAGHEKFIRVLSGALTLKAAKQQQTFKAGDTVGISPDFDGECRFSEGYRGLLVRNAASTVVK